jgi:hypothetical protein
MSPLTTVVYFWVALVALLSLQQYLSISGFVGHVETPAPVNTNAPATTDLSFGPAASSLNPREPYHLLKGWLESNPSDSLSCLNSACCSETDFEQRTNMVGNYLQRTNNYKRGTPDNCSTPLHELTLSFYKPLSL